MNEQFVKTLLALEAAEKEMAELHDTLDGLEIVSRASWHESETADHFRRELRVMMSSVTAMLEKREKALLECVRVQHRMHPTSGSLRDLQVSSTPETLSASQTLSTPPTSG